MLRLVHCKRLLILSSVLFSVEALAQFEISPDHFESAEKNAVTRQKARAKNRLNEL